MRKILMIALALMLVFSLAACGGGGDGGNGSGSGGGTAAPSVAGDDDPCPCCPECVQAECVCEECGGNDDYDCKCAAPGGGGSFTFLVEIDTNFIGSLGQGNRTFGTATVTLDDFDSSGWYGSAEGIGEYTDWTVEGFALLEYDIGYDFTVQLSGFDPLKADSITIGVDRFCSETETWEDLDDIIGTLKMDGAIMMSFDYHRMDLLDEKTGLFTFELPMENGIAKLVDHWVEPPPGMIVIDMIIIVTQLD